MVYAYDNWVLLPTKDIYDTLMMAMAINAAKDMYDEGQQRMKDFYTQYGNFVTPIKADQDWYNTNVIGRVRDAVNNLYAAGIDPARSSEGRAAIAQLINSVDVGSVNKLRSSAENAKEFLKARKLLEAQGLYNPLLAKYDGPDINTYSTLDSGVWDKMSPTRITDMATFGNPYFEGMKPNVHRQSKKGIEYTVELITENDLKNIADAHFNELVSTPQGSLMYQYYRDIAGGDDTAARSMFNQAVADGQRRRIYTKDDYEDNYFKSQQLDNARAQLELRRKQLELQAERNRILANKGGSGSKSSGNNSNKDLVSYYEPLYQNLVVNTLNKDPMSSTTFSNKEFTLDMGNSILGAQRNIANLYFGVSGKNDIYGGKPLVSRVGIDYTTGNITGSPHMTNKLNNFVDPSISGTKEFKTNFNKNYRSYLDLFTIGDYSGGFSSMFANSWKQGSAKIDDLTYQGKSVDKIKGLNYVSFGLSDINTIYSAKEISARMAGITGPVLEEAKKETQALRNRLRVVLEADNGSVAIKATSPIGSGLGDVGLYGIFANAEFKNTNGNEITLLRDAVIKTPFMSTPNPNASTDDRLNLSFDQTLDLERNLMDNKAVRSLGVSSNNGSIDNTLPESDPWYTLNDDFSDFDWNY